MAARPTVQVVQSIYRTRDDCRVCGGSDLIKIWSFGLTPLANSYVRPDQANVTEPLVPLQVYRCHTCQLVQLRDVVDPAILFSNYTYVSSTSPTFVKHFEEYASRLTKRFALNSNSLVIDIGSNDGILLKPLLRQGVKVLGVEPAANIAAWAAQDGIETVTDFFSSAVAAKIKQNIGAADVITANNVFAHTDDINSFVAAVKHLLAKDGVYVFEVQYLGDLIAKNLFDIVYHEHLCYYHLHPLVSLFSHHDMDVFDVERPAVHGGSIRVYVQHTGGPHYHNDRVDELLAAEKRQGLTSPKAFVDFAARIAHNQDKLRQTLLQIKSTGARIVGYGAPAKATTLLHVFELDSSILDYIVDDDRKIKQGLLMPGTHIPIVPPARLYIDKPEYCLILAWNFAEPIMANHKRFTEQGGKFIIPVPEPKIV